MKMWSFVCSCLVVLAVARAGARADAGRAGRRTRAALVAGTGSGEASDADDGLAPQYVPGSDGTYAQNYQDVWVKKLAEHNGWSNCFFLDLGAYHGTECSNSALLEKEGWTGVCVEPEPRGFETRSCVLVSRPLSDTPDESVGFFGSGQVKHIGKRDFEDSPSDKGSKMKTMTIAELFACVSNTAQSFDCSGVQGRVPIPEFIHFVSLDIEGNEAKILKTFPWHEFKVGAFIVEQTADQSRPPEVREETRQILKSQGYIQVDVTNAGVDEYFVLPEFFTNSSLREKEWRVHPEGSNGC